MSAQAEQQPSIGDRRAVWSWALYDWANSAFATTVVAGLFPVFYPSFWRAGVEGDRVLSELGFANTAASIAVAVIAPVLGAIADRGGRRKLFLGMFTALSCACVVALGVLGESHWQGALVAFLLASLGFNAALSFYDALLVDVATEDKLDRISALGFGLGYLGGGLLFAINVLMIQKFESFGFASKPSAVQVAFLTVAGWWLVFTVPLMLFVRERQPAERLAMGAAAAAGIQQLRDTFRHLRSLRPVLMFVIAYFVYIDGVNTVYRMGVAYGAMIGIESGELIKALLLTQFVAFPSALMFGRVGERLGPRVGITIALCIYAVGALGATQMQTATHFYMLAATIGLVMGGIQSLSRSLYAQLIPPDKSGEFFGFYNMLGKAAAIVGPTLMGITALMLGEGQERYAILPVPLLFIVGGVLLWRVPLERRGT